MNTSGEAAEQLVRMSLNGVEVIAKISGKGSLKLASVLYNELKSNKRSKGKQRFETMLRSGKQLKVFGVKDTDLARFSKEAKKYGFPFCVLKDRDATDGITDIMVGADDASKVNRIFERFKLSEVDQSIIDTEVQRTKTQGSEIPVPETNPPQKEVREENFVEELMRKPAPNHEQVQTLNPISGTVAKSRQSEPISKAKNKGSTMGTPINDERSRPSVQKELKEIQTDMEKKAQSRNGRTQKKRQNKHIVPQKNIKNKKMKEK
ncbi:MAG: PcfB family protein [Eubacteriales bacterium]|nr:PcfB family protein [Eubacteriales bacterium]MDD4474388.1 PcfB family protein [Eubacteriales bacterium]